MSQHLSGFTVAQLQSLQQTAREVLDLVLQESIDRPDLNSSVRQVLHAEDALTTFTELASHEPDVMSLILRLSVSSLVNAKGIAMIDAEIIGRSIPGN